MTAAVRRVHAAVADALAAHPAVVLAVSGGRDSVVLLDAALAVARERVRLVATFDHGTGPAARAAAAHVRALAAAAGVRVCVGRRHPTDARAGARCSEAAWRAARWRFLRTAARRASAAGAPPVPVVTGHTRDDQCETVVLRLLRHTGARGLAAMAASSAGVGPVVRPLLGVAAADVRRYAAARGLRWVEDPSNASGRYRRNRVRGELLPALARVDPRLRAGLLRDARAAAALRAALDDAAARFAAGCAAPRDGGRGTGVPVARLAALAPLDARALAALWPALAARAGVRLDRRGVATAVAYTRACAAAAGRPGDPRPARCAAYVPLGGGATLAVERRALDAPGRPPGAAEAVLVVRPRPACRLEGSSDGAALDLGRAGAVVRLGAWRLRAASRPPGDAALAAGRVAWLAADRPYLVRAWRSGDRWRPEGAAAARRVKRFLADGRVPALDRAGWPVVVALGARPAPEAAGPAAAAAPEGQIVWVPGVRRSRAAPDRPGQPGCYLLCERTPERPRGR